MIDLSQYEIGQRFRTRGGLSTTLLPSRAGGLYWLACEDGHTSGFDKSGIGNALAWPYEPIRPIVPANTRRIPSIKLDPVLEKAV